MLFDTEFRNSLFWPVLLRVTAYWAGALAVHDLVTFNSARGVAGIDHQLRFLDNPAVIVIGVVGNDDHAVVLAKIAEVGAYFICRSYLRPLPMNGK